MSTFLRDIENTKKILGISGFQLCLRVLKCSQGHQVAHNRLGKLTRKRCVLPRLKLNAPTMTSTCHVFWLFYSFLAPSSPFISNTWKHTAVWKITDFFLVQHETLFNMIQQVFNFSWTSFTYIWEKLLVWRKCFYAMFVYYFHFNL